MTRRRASSRQLIVTGLALATLPMARAAAQLAEVAPACTLPRADTSRTWPAPLDRIVAGPARAETTTVRVALDRLAAAARVHFSYSPELLRVDARTCIPAGAHVLGDVLRAVLRDTGIVPVVAGRDQVVLAPGRTAAGADAAPMLARTIGRLERVVVTGTSAGGSERGSPFALAVIEGDALRRAGTQSLAQLLDAAVPGIWLWAQPPTSAVARYGSVRGASSFGVSVPKVYIDGIEVANPLLLTQLDATRVHRVEVIRGPQGAALYGADAISGVINVVTRHDGSPTGAPTGEARASAGAARSAFAPQSVIAQQHGLSLQAGSAARSAGLGVALSSIGAYVPGASARQLDMSAGARWVGARAVVTATARAHAADTDAPPSPLFDGVPALSSIGQQRVRQATIGATATLQPSGDWTHVLIAGLDGYRLAGMPTDGLLMVSSAADSALRAARGAAERLTLRASSTRHLSLPGARTLSLTLGGEHSVAREHTTGAGMRLGAYRAPADSAYHTSDAATAWSSNTGALAMGQMALPGGVFLHGGARIEYVSGLADGAQVALLPMLGAAWVRERGPLSLKLRGAYGRGIRPARTLARTATWMSGDARLLASLAPEEQSGIETGADLLWDAPGGLHLALRATRFDQRAAGLVQPVATYDTTVGTTGAGEPGGLRARRERTLGYLLQNVGAIDNTGWELQATAARGGLSLTTALTLVDSRVHRLVGGYRGDLRAGDRMLEVPARTVGLTAAWTQPRWSLSGTLARASDWVNYDRVALASAYAAVSTVGETGTDAPVGRALADYWRDYPGVTRLGARGAFTLWRTTALTLAADNLLDRQTGEPDNVTVLPGRTLLVGLRTGF